MRKISFKLLTQGRPVSIQSAARTFADLQQEIQTNPELKDVIIFGKSQFIDNASKAQYGTIPEAVLPATDCLFFVVPTETKSGCRLPSLAEVEEMSYAELRTVGSKLNKENGAAIDLTGKRSDILPRVVDFLSSVAQKKEEVEEYPSVADAIVEHAQKIIELVNEWKVSKVKEEEVFFKLTLSEVETEANRLASLFKK